MLTLLTILGIIFCPILTFGAVLIHFGHPFLGIFAIIVSLLRADTGNED
jgi:hypothetical protein